MSYRNPTIVLTGGPCGGKTTLMRELRADDSEARRWLLIPEAAPLLFQAGLDARRKEFQRAVVQVQIALEQACRDAAKPGQILVCHRGTLDALAYWLRNGWPEAEFFGLTGLTHEQHLGRYDGVIHLQTTAIGATDHYRRWPDAHRPETIEQAAEIDRLCAQVWQPSLLYVRVSNSDCGWVERSNAAMNLLKEWLTLTLSTDRKV